MNEVTVNVSPELRDAYESGAKFKAGGFFTIEHVRNGEVIHTEDSTNIVVDEGLTYILDTALSAATQKTSWYIGIFKNNYTPIAGNVAATFAGSGVANEVSTEVDETARPAWTEAGVSSKTITNSASPAAFTANTSVSVYGAFLISDSTMGGTSGTLCAASKFSSVRNLLNTDVLNITYTLSIADA
jgi:hypothetical protein